MMVPCVCFLLQPKPTIPRHSRILVQQRGKSCENRMAALWFYVLAPQETERPETADILWERNCQMTNCAGQKKMLGGVLPWHPLLHSFETGPLVEPGARLVP